MAANPEEEAGQGLQNVRKNDAKFDNLIIDVPTVNCLSPDYCKKTEKFLFTVK